jgi:hypothetical protein
MTAGDKAHRTVLDESKCCHVRGLGVRKPDGGRVIKDRLDKDPVGHEERFLVVEFRHLTRHIDR